MVQIEQDRQLLRTSQNLVGSVEVRDCGEHQGGIAAWCLVAVLLLSCEQQVVIATWSCPLQGELRATAGAAGSAGAVDVAGAASNAGAAGHDGSGVGEESVEFPWSTGFEQGFCDYSDSVGFCWSPAASKRIVVEPVHSGQFAAEYSVDSTQDGRGGQSRCVLRGAFPTEAYYGAWYFLPTLPKKAPLWNLFHFQGRNTTSEDFHDLWDVSLVIRDDGNLHLALYDFGRNELPDQSNAAPVPIGKWVHIELYVKRASDRTGEFALYQDGVVVVRMTAAATDDSRSGQWYVGNYAHGLEPPESTVYVDDVTLSPARS